MQYTARGFVAGNPVSNDQQIYSGYAGCWGNLANTHYTRGNVINQISFQTEVERYNDTAYRALKPEGMTDIEFITQCVDAINEGYLDYVVEKQGSYTVITVNNLHDKLKQRTMWILFVLRSLFQYSGTGKLAKVMKEMKTKFTLRELILLSQSFYVGTNMGDRSEFITHYSSGGVAIRHRDMSLADFRAILRGGRYYTGSELSKVTWSQTGGYKSGTNVQNTSRAMDTSDIEAVRESRGLYDAMKAYHAGKVEGSMTHETFRKFLRLVKYYKKD